MKKQTNNYFKLSVFLGTVSAVAGLVIFSVHNLTAPIITNQAIAAEKNNLEKLFPNSEFIVRERTDDEKVLAVYEVKDKGYVVKMTDIGYNGSTPIIVLVAFDREGVSVGLQVLQHQETSGFGAGCFESDFLQKTYLHKTSGDTIDGLSGATRTSQAMQRIFAAAFKAIEALK